MRAMVVDAKTGKVLHAENEDAPRHPASVTKVMTLYLLFEQLERGPDRPRHPASPFRPTPPRQAPSKLGLRPGSTIEVEDAIKALVTKSANDVAVVVAENIAGSEEAFAEHDDAQGARARHEPAPSTATPPACPIPSRSRRPATSPILGRAIQDRFPKYYRYFQTRVFNYAGAHASATTTGSSAGSRASTASRPASPRASGFNLLTSASTGEPPHRGRRPRRPLRRRARSAMAALIDDHSAPRLCRRPHRAGDRGSVGPAAPGGHLRGDPAARRAAGRRRRRRSRPRFGAKPQPLDVAAMRPVVATTTPTTTPTSLRWSTGAQPIPAAAQAYAPVEPAVAPPPRPHPLVEPAPAAVAAAKIEARLPEMTVAEAGARRKTRNRRQGRARPAAAGGGAAPAPGLARRRSAVGSSSSARPTTRARPRTSSRRRAAAPAASSPRPRPSPRRSSATARRSTGPASPASTRPIRRTRPAARSSAAASPASRPGADDADRPPQRGRTIDPTPVRSTGATWSISDVGPRERPWPR